MPEDFFGVGGSGMGEPGFSGTSEGEEVKFEKVYP